MKLRWKKPIEKKPLLNEHGSSSVLVIMIMLLLITFGVLAMMSSYSNLKIAQKHAQWTSDYYQLESIASSDLKSFEQLFESAIADTKANFVNSTFDPSTFADMPEGIKANVLERVEALVPDNKEAINALSNQLFLYHLYDAYMTAPIFDKHYSSNFGYDVFNQTVESEAVPEITFITTDEATQRQLLVKIAIELSKNDVQTNTFAIMEWRELPIEFEYDETLDFEDPEGN